MPDQKNEKRSDQVTGRPPLRKRYMERDPGRLDNVDGMDLGLGEGGLQEVDYGDLRPGPIVRRRVMEKPTTTKILAATGGSTMPALPSEGLLTNIKSIVPADGLPSNFPPKSTAPRRHFELPAPSLVSHPTLDAPPVRARTFEKANQAVATPSEGPLKVTPRPGAVRRQFERSDRPEDRDSVLGATAVCKPRPRMLAFEQPALPNDMLGAPAERSLSVVTPPADSPSANVSGTLPSGGHHVDVPVPSAPRRRVFERPQEPHPVNGPAGTAPRRRTFERPPDLHQGTENAWERTVPPGGDHLDVPAPAAPRRRAFERPAELLVFPRKRTFESTKEATIVESRRFQDIEGSPDSVVEVPLDVFVEGVIDFDRPMNPKHIYYTPPPEARSLMVRNISQRFNGATHPLEGYWTPKDPSNIHFDNTEYPDNFVPPLLSHFTEDQLRNVDWKVKKCDFNMPSYEEKLHFVKGARLTQLEWELNNINLLGEIEKELEELKEELLPLVLY